MFDPTECWASKGDTTLSSERKQRVTEELSRERSEALEPQQAEAAQAGAWFGGGGWDSLDTAIKEAEDYQRLVQFEIQK